MKQICLIIMSILIFSIWGCTGKKSKPSNKQTKKETQILGDLSFIQDLEIMQKKNFKNTSSINLILKEEYRHLFKKIVDYLNLLNIGVKEIYKSSSEQTNIIQIKLQTRFKDNPMEFIYTLMNIDIPIICGIKYYSLVYGIKYYSLLISEVTQSKMIIKDDIFELHLIYPLFYNANVIACDINILYGKTDDNNNGFKKIAHVVDSKTIRVAIPKLYQKFPFQLVSAVINHRLTDFIKPFKYVIYPEDLIIQLENGKNYSIRYLSKIIDVNKGVDHFMKEGEFKIQINQPNLKNAVIITDYINLLFGETDGKKKRKIATLLNPSTIKVIIPKLWKEIPYQFMSAILNINIKVNFSQKINKNTSNKKNKKGTEFDLKKKKIKNIQKLGDLSFIQNLKIMQKNNFKNTNIINLVLKEENRHHFKKIVNYLNLLNLGSLGQTKIIQIKLQARFKNNPMEFINTIMNFDIPIGFRKRYYPIKVRNITQSKIIIIDGTFELHLIQPLIYNVCTIAGDINLLYGNVDETELGMEYKDIAYVLNPETISVKIPKLYKKIPYHFVSGVLNIGLTDFKKPFKSVIYPEDMIIKLEKAKR